MTRVVKLIFLDNDPAKRAVCDEANRTARVVKIPRALLSECVHREELTQVGLYLLFGENVDEPDRNFVYVGESENVLARLSEHALKFEKFDWHTALVLIAQDRALNKAHVKYLEHEWHARLMDANAAVVDQNIPTRSSLNEAERAIANDFSVTGQFLVEALGYRVFEKKSQIVQPAGATTAVPRFVFETSVKLGNKSYGQPVKEGFLVEEGSILDLELKKAGKDYWGPVREKLVSQGVIGLQGGRLVFLKDWLAPSPSRAAGVAYGGSVNGLEYWQTVETSETLRSWQAKNTIA